MASVTWRRNKEVTIYYWDNNSKKLVPLPRAQTKHLDGMPKDYVYKWVEDWEKEHGRTRARAERINLSEQDVLSVLWAQYQIHQMKRKKRRSSTAQDETEILEKYICPYFVGKYQKKDPSDWHPLIPGFHDYLFEKYKDRTIQKILWTLERFGKYLIFKQHMTFPFVVEVPARGNDKITPLKARKTPEQIIKFVTDTDFGSIDIDFKLAILLGYFGALSPSELFALEKSDLITGAFAESQCKTLEGFKKHKLGSKLGVSINKTLPHRGKQVTSVSLTKNDYRTGIVNIWHSGAAKLIASMVRNKPDGRLFPYSYGWLERAWRENVKKRLGTTPHDLRRASCLYLGREVRIELTLLQEHMRHAEIETTMLYAREPSIPEKRIKFIQNFDDVA